MQHLVTFEQVHVGGLNRSNMPLFHTFCVLNIRSTGNVSFMYTECVCILQDWNYSCTHSYPNHYTDISGQLQNLAPSPSPPSREGVTSTCRQSGHFGEDRKLLPLPQILHLYHSLITVLPELPWLHVLFTHALYLNKASFPVDIYVYSAVIFINTGM